MTNDDVLKEFVDRFLPKSFQEIEEIKSFLKTHLEAAYARGASDMREKAIAAIPHTDNTSPFIVLSGWNACREAILKAIAALPIDEQK